MITANLPAPRRSAQIPVAQSEGIAFFTCMGIRVVRAIILSITVSVSSTAAVTLTVERGSDLQSVIDFAADGDTISLGAKTFKGYPSRFVDPLCGNCEDPQTEVSATYGFLIKNKALVIVGKSRTETILETKAGYGIYFENSHGSTLSNLTVTGGVRDADGNATDAAVVVRNSLVSITSVNIVDNDYRIDTVVVGIGGIVGREGAEILHRELQYHKQRLGWNSPVPGRHSNGYGLRNKRRTRGRYRCHVGCFVCCLSQRGLRLLEGDRRFRNLMGDSSQQSRARQSRMGPYSNRAVLYGHDQQRRLPQR